MRPLPTPAEALAERLGGAPLHYETVGGGSINSCGKVTLADGRRLFLKRNSAPNFPQLLSLEMAGLKFIAEPQLVRTPKVMDQWEDADYQYLLLEWIDQETPGPAFWEDFGRRLAALHATLGETFGGVPDNYMGSVPQRNVSHDNWTDFFLAERLLPAARRCQLRDLMGMDDIRRIERLIDPLDGLFADARPCRVHGDLWSGNFLCAAGGEPVLIDPAPYWGERSVDLAMTTLFGGFDARFYAAYDEVAALHPEHKAQWALMNLYPLLIHLYLFGSSYYGAIDRTLRSFC
ncbi:fructosamine kinase family protein [Flaviaesturariibacter terrae]